MHELWAHLYRPLRGWQAGRSLLPFFCAADEVAGQSPVPFRDPAATNFTAMKVRIHLFGSDPKASPTGSILLGMPQATKHADAVISDWDDLDACEEVFALGNNPSRVDEWAAIWGDKKGPDARPWGTRSFSVGDAVTLEPDAARVRHFVCAPLGFLPISAERLAELASVPVMSLRSDLVSKWAEPAQKFGEIAPL